MTNHTVGYYDVKINKVTDGYYGSYKNHKTGISNTFKSTKDMSKKQILAKFYDRVKHGE
jgi:hypothetical protein